MQYFGKFEFNNIVNGEYYIYAYRESNLTSVTYDGYSEDFLVDGYTVELDTLTLNIILKQQINKQLKLWILHQNGKVQRELLKFY